MAKNQPVTLDQLERVLDKRLAKQKEEITSEIRSEFRDDIRGLGKSINKQMKTMFANQQTYLQGEFKAVNNRFDDQEQKLKDWKSEIYSKIDEGYAGPLKNQQVATDIHHGRLSENRDAINKINKHIGLPQLPSFDI